MDGCFGITGFFKKCKKPQNNPKATPKPTPINQILDFQWFCCFYWGYWGNRDIYRKNDFYLQKSCQLTDWSVGLGRIDHFPLKTPKTPKKFLKCLIFNGLVFWGSFVVVLWWSCGGLNSLIFNNLPNIKQVLVPQCF